MRKTAKSLIAMALVLTGGLSSLPVVSAASISSVEQHAIVQPRYQYIAATDCWISDNGDDTAEFYAYAAGDSGVSRIVFTVDVQKKGLFGIYSTIDTLTKTSYANSYIYSDTVSIDSSQIYRLKVTYKVYTSTGTSESHTEYSEATLQA